MLSGQIGWVRRLLIRPITLYVLLCIVLLAVLVHSLGSHPAGLSPAELSAENNSQKISSLINHPINLPHNLLAFLFHRLGGNWAASLRASSVVYALIFVYAFFSLAKSWFGRSVGILGTVIFASTPLVLVMARQGSAEIMMLGLIVPMTLFHVVSKNKLRELVILLLILSAALLLYTPGLVWWLAGAVLIARKKLADIFRESPPPIVGLGILLALLAISPLVIGLIKDWTLIKQLALLPPSLPDTLNILKDIGWMLLAVFYKAPSHNPLIIGQLPLLNIVQVALLVFGSFALWGASKTKLFIAVAVFIFAVLAAGFNNNLVLLAICLPSISIVITAGLRYLYIEWRGIFPKNPLARSLAIALMAALVAIQLLFGISYAAIAWPNSVDTKNTYVLK